VSGLDIPEGTKLERVLTGGDDTLQMITDLLGKKLFTGYALVRLEGEAGDITSYMIIKDSEPIMGLREIVTRDKKNPRRRIRKVYAGEHTLKDVLNDIQEKTSTIELHANVDVDSIIERYKPAKKKEAEDKEMEEGQRDVKRVGLFWGGKEDEESLEREILHEKLEGWRQEGYDVTPLESIFPENLTEVKVAFQKFEDDVTTLEELAAELEFLSLSGLEREIDSIKTKLKDPKLIPEIKAEIEVLENKASKIREGEKKNICLVCGLPLEDHQEKCPRCGALAPKREKETVPLEGIELESGHCYLIEEEKLNRTLKLYANMLDKGYKGFCITRTNPKHLEEMEELENSTVIWLTDKESSTATTIPPVLERIIYEIGDFLKLEEKSCLILDGVEYLVSNNTFDAVLRFIRKLIDDISESKSILMVTVGPYTLKERELKILEREMEIIS